MPVGEQVAIIYLGSKGLLQKVAVKDVRKFEGEFLAFMRDSHPNIIEALAAGKFTDAETSVLEKVAADMVSLY